ncbi:MAG: HAMP domain-containing histidine kinase [Deltaproteobacteria bacterium]|nr:HAMP domain-containing histidine kinase [Deltaproteobacteria bacterium]
MHKQRIKLEFLVHDLKVPLAVIEAGISSLIQKRDKYGSLSDKQLQVLERALRNTIITQRLVNDVLELGRSSEGVINRCRFLVSSFVEQALIEIFDLTDHETTDRIRECKNLASLQKTIAPKGVYLDISEILWAKEVYLDESKSRQILRNLLSNALKYRKDRVDLRFYEEERFLCISVKDDGEGIPSSYHEKIFQCYFQMDARTNQCVRGHGLGLAGVMVLLEDMGGSLALASDAGKGATFLVRMPFS